MTDRIRELAEQAGCSIDGLGYGEGDVEGLVKLIVLECANLHANKLEKRPCSEYNRGRIELAQEIKQHFGVR